MIYVTSPYFSQNPTTRAARYDAVQKYVYDMYIKGQWTYSPIVHYHPMALKYGMNLDVNAWFNSNFQLLKLADELHVLTLNGWDTAPGVQADIAFVTNTIGVSKIKYITPTTQVPAPPVEDPAQ